MRRQLQGALVVIGIGALFTNFSRTSAEDRQREAQAADFNQWLGQDKQSRVRQVGPPDNCTQVTRLGDEICVWVTNGNALFYRYDGNGIAQHWLFKDRPLREMEGSQDWAQNGDSRM